MAKTILDDLAGVYAVPPLPRKADSRRTLDLDAAERVAQHIEEGGVTRYLYGGNAFLYHVTLDEYAALLEWLSGFAPPRWAIPSIGPSFGRAMVCETRAVAGVAFDLGSLAGSIANFWPTGSAANAGSASRRRARKASRLHMVNLS